MCVIRIGDILKTSGPKNHIGEKKFHAYPNDFTICPLYCLRQYLEAMNKPFQMPSKGKLVRWVKQTLKDSGINMSIFFPHSTRNASNSKTNTYIPLKTYLEIGGGGAIARLQGFMTNQFSKKNNIDLVYSTLKNVKTVVTVKTQFMNTDTLKRIDLMSVAISRDPCSLMTRGISINLHLTVKSWLIL